MKNSNLFILILLVLIACKSNPKHPGQDSIINAPPTVDYKAIIKKITPIIQGTWVKKAYIEKVQKLRSPLAAVDEASDMTTFVIDPQLIKGDSLVVLAGWGNHEGGEMTMKFKQGTKPSSVIFGAGELSLSVINGENILTYYRQDEKSKKNIATQYIQALSTKPGELGEGTYYLVNKVLVAGNYILTDSVGHISKINFDAHGKIIGFLDYQTYSINVDLNTDAMDNLDEITFNLYKRNVKSYSFKFDADTLNLYETKPNADSSELLLDKLKYKLVKQK